MEDKDELELRVSSKEVQDKIKYYYNQQVINLINTHKRKMGFSCEEAKTLLTFMKSQNVETLEMSGVQIPQAGFKEYIIEYNMEK